MVFVERTLIKATNVDTGNDVMFKTQSDAARVLGLKQQNISSCLRGTLKKTGQWQFEYVTVLERR